MIGQDKKPKVKGAWPQGEERCYARRHWIKERFSSCSPRSSFGDLESRGSSIERWGLDGESVCRNGGFVLRWGTEKGSRKSTGLGIKKSGF